LRDLAAAAARGAGPTVCRRAQPCEPAPRSSEKFREVAAVSVHTLLRPRPIHNKTLLYPPRRMTNPPDHREWHRLFNAALNDELSDADSLELAAVLKSSAEARQLWFLYHDNECSLAEMSPAVEPKTRSTGLSWFSWRQLTAVAAGLFIGLFGASVVWGYVGPYAGKVVTLLQESFESGPPPLTTGIPVEAGHWSGDYSQVVGEYRGVKPAGGRKMLRFLRSDYEGKPTRDGFIGDVFRIIDVSGPEYDVARGDACVSVEARFPLPASRRSRPGFLRHLDACHGCPANARRAS
jgi:hypothetical protein